MNPEERIWFGIPEETTPQEHSLSELPERAPEPWVTFKRNSRPDVFAEYGIPKQEDHDLSEPSHAPEELFGPW